MSGCGDSAAPEPQAATTTETAPVDAAPAVLTTVAEAKSIEPVASAKPPSNPEADALFATLTSPETPEEWEQAHVRLVELGEAALPTLTRELTSDDAFRRETAASALAMLGSVASGAQGELRAALADESIHVRANAATALCAIPEQADVVIPVLTQLVVSEDEQVRQMSAVNLSNFGEEAAPHVPKLAEVLKVAPSDVLVPVVELLGRIGPDAESAAPQLQQIVFEQEGEAKQAATAALERINAKP
jgi:HEAT repeat protein